ncbi:MAG: glycoside hydrolase [Betaproteobacteria bacterium CG2_30_68_42]|nr:MAG: glycoside hydrolase [Betaproteobacteria bacterium CG2_30_68_42]
MPARNKLDLVLVWHMHQPDYRDHASGEFRQPWVYLHAIKDYCDMASHLERHPGVRAVVNFVPVLLDQIEDYVRQFATGELRDPLLRMLVHPNLNELRAGERHLLREWCFRSNHVTMVTPFPRYRRLHELYRSLEGGGEAALDFLSGAFYADLVTWYHLSWIGETERRIRPLAAELLAKGEGFTHADRMHLFDALGQIVSGLLPRYRALAAAGRIELSATPYAHPIAPLLLDLKCAREAMPEAPLPDAMSYPGGRARVFTHIDQAAASHEHRFGARCEGMWPAEGAVSTAFLQLLAGRGLRWAASSESVLANSLRRAGGGSLPERSHYLYRGYRIEAAPGLAVFFRDEKLSDLIGFEYARWHGRDAANHFVGELDAIRSRAPAGATPLVSVILDGENAWEHYPYNGYYFFEDLYSSLEAHAFIRSTTFGRYLADTPNLASLPAVVAGSWVYGTLSTWIGSPDKNRAWDLLCAAKQSYDLVIDSGRLDEQEKAAAEAQLMVCEGSDWFWWCGDYNPRAVVRSFDELYRGNLAGLYARLKLPPPVELASPLSQGNAESESVGTMRRAG